MIKFSDFPKIECPFVRKEINGNYVVTPEIAEGFGWVFEDKSVICVEKLHGTCCAIVIENGVVIAMFNRTNRIPFIGGTISKALTEGVNNAFAKNRFVLQDGIIWGELIGERMQKNEYKIQGYDWVPFDWLKKHCYYKSWGRYPKDFETISNWFKELLPLYSLMKGNKEGFVEGIVFTHPDGRMAKIRKDMFSWAGNKGKDIKPK